MGGTTSTKLSHSTDDGSIALTSRQACSAYVSRFAAFGLLVNHEADAAITNRFYGASHAKDVGLEGTAVIFDPTDLFFAASKGDQKKLLASTDRDLSALKKGLSGCQSLEGPSSASTRPSRSVMEKGFLRNSMPGPITPWSSIVSSA